MNSRLRNTVIVGLALIATAGATLVSGATPQPSDPVAGKSHWAFHPLEASGAAGEVDRIGSRRSIDDFIESKLQAAKLRPVPAATRRVLIRRTYFQLIGLPPTPEQVRSFLADRRPDAFERVVDQLLGSPQFGERWGRHWLDLVRYADSNGLDENFLFREAWRYRNWVVDAINADLGFDRFLLEQIAGDALPFESISQRDRQRVAAGFLVIGPKVLLGNDAGRQRMEVADEQIDTIGRAFLGLTLGCARCHDHKFEPIPRADYYALAGILTSTQIMEQRYMLGEQRVMERLVGLGSEGDTLNASYEKYWREVPKFKERFADAKSVLVFLEKTDTEGLNPFLEKHPEAISEAAKDTTLPAEERIAAQKAMIAEFTAVLSQPPKIPPRAMIPAESASPSDEAIRLAGQFDRLGERVPRGFLNVLSSGDRPSIPTGKSGRLELARWLTDCENGAGNLTARVLANRIWQHLIGRGIVRTVDNLGRTGELPSHPELLDYLARELIHSGWSVKSVVRKIVLSRTFARSSASTSSAEEIDPENQLLWRAHRLRLEPESLRDAMLMVAGQLDPARVDSSVGYLGDQATAVGKNEVRRRTDFPCRSIYLPVIRNDLPELFEAFDFADPHATTGARPRTTSAKQALFILNDRTVMDAAGKLARRIIDEDPTAEAGARIDRLYELTFNVPPTGEERNALVAAETDFEKAVLGEGVSDPSGRAWAMVCHSLFSLSRFQFLE